jgi:hypothetical protein
MSGNPSGGRGITTMAFEADGLAAGMWETQGSARLDLGVNDEAAVLRKGSVERSAE